MSPKMLTAFKDGTKTMVEMTAMSNATGFLPAVTNGTGYESTVKKLDQVYRLKSEGGILDHYQAVDYINGVAPGVYAIITSKLPEVRHELTYLQVGPGPNYTPVSYTHLHIPSIKKAFFSRALFIILCNCGILSAIGFSHKTFTPASSACITKS